MENLEEKFKLLPEEEIPRNFHMRLIGYILDKKLKTPFYVLASLFSINLIYSAWSLFVRLAENGAISAISAAFEGFSLTSGFVSDLSETLSDVLPIHTLILFLINLAIVSYIIYLIFKMKSAEIEKVDIKK